MLGPRFTAASCQMAAQADMGTGTLSGHALLEVEIPAYCVPFVLDIPGVALGEGTGGDTGFEGTKRAVTCSG